MDTSISIQPKDRLCTADLGGSSIAIERLGGGGMSAPPGAPAPGDCPAVIVLGCLKLGKEW